MYLGLVVRAITSRSMPRAVLAGQLSPSVLHLLLSALLARRNAAHTETRHPLLITGPSNTPNAVGVPPTASGATRPVYNAGLPPPPTGGGGFTKVATVD